MKCYSDKETRILDTAAEYFAKEPFHKVLLSDVARSAAVGKGTLYLYFKSKDDLYFEVLFREFSTLVDRLQAFISEEETRADKQITGIVRILVDYFFNKTISLDLMSFVMACPSTDEWRDKRAELRTLIEKTVQRGIDQGRFENSNPRLTAVSIPGLIRSACLFNPDNLDAESICNHATHFVLHGIEKQH